ncbi:SPOR domain-containing protein [Corynebacterium qintianiae]|uniref:SPOR domain-containing protein n=1 Tax=Corynebacterium qintianiae TaxID=2709392 RepID=UPI0013EDE658|nr:SPOR domain-containing protein [Corynebacterium qintianiae]
MADEQFYYNPSTGEVTQGKEAAWDERMGPYATREEAEAAIQNAKERNKQADAVEEADANWGKPASWEK